MGALAVVMAVAAVPVAGQAQSASAAADTRTAQPRTPWGEPDLQGVWEYRTLTPLQRPAEWAGKQTITDAEAAEFEKAAVAEQEDRQDNQIPADIVGNYNHFWWERGTKLANNRTSLIVDPPDGRLPAFTAEAQRRADSPEAKWLADANRGDVPPRSWEDLEPGDRCIQHGKAGPPLNPSGYNSNIQLFQTQGYVAILNEQIHEARIIPLDGRPHLGPQIRQWMGDSRGRWEGDTLVVETTNFNGRHEQVGRPYWMLNSARLTLVERFTRVDADTILYEYTVNDPTIWVKPWTAQFPMTTNPNRLYEYACHEGNYSMAVRLAGARAEEKTAAEAARKGSK
jgi:hypothetical protein